MSLEENIKLCKSVSQLTIIIIKHFKHYWTRVKKMLMNIPIINNYIYFNLVEAAKIFYTKTDKLPEKMSERFGFSNTHNQASIEEYSIYVFLDRLGTEKDNIYLYGMNMTSHEHEQIPLEKIKK